jgi:two-component system LytT family response regulator
VIRALLVDDEAPARNRMTRLLRPIADIEIVGEADNGLKALEEIERLKWAAPLGLERF